MVDYAEARKNAEHVDLEEIGDFFQKTGAVELISLLDSTGYRFDEIDDELDVSRGIINKRVGEARGLKLITTGDITIDGKVYRVNKLTFIGEAMRQHMRGIGLVKTHERLRSVLEEFESQHQEFTEWAQDQAMIDKQIEQKLTRISKKDTHEGF